MVHFSFGYFVDSYNKVFCERANNVFCHLLRRLSSGTSQRAYSSRTSRVSAATQGNSGDGGGGDDDDEKMRQLKERNRMAAHRSREKKKVL